MTKFNPRAFFRDVPVRRRLFVIHIVCVAMLSAGIYLTYRYCSRMFIKRGVQTTGDYLEKAGHELESEIHRYVSDAQMLSHTPPIQGIIRARLSATTQGGDLNRTDYFQWTDRMQTVFASMAQANPEYRDFAYLDESGREIVHVISDGRQIISVGLKELTRTPEKSSFQQTMSQPPGAVFVSDMMLNRRGGVIDTPPTPVMHFGIPVVDESSGARRGCVLINVDGSGFAHNIGLPGGGHILIANADGFYLHHPDATREFGCCLGDSHNLRLDDPEIMEAAAAMPKYVDYYPAERRVDGFQKIYFDPSRKDRYWILYGEIPEAILFADLRLMRSIIFAVGILAILLASGLIMVVSESIVSPILSLVDTTRSISSGILNTRSPIRSRDEIGGLAASINEMATAFERLRELEKAAMSTELEKFVALVENSSDFIGMSTLDGRAIYLNNAGRRLIGYSEQQDIRGVPIEESLMPSGVTRLKGEVFPAVLHRGVWSGETQLRNQVTGEPIDVEISAFAVKNSRTGEPVCMAAIAHDIRQRIESHRSIQMMARFAEENPAPVLRFDRRGRLLMCNPAAQRILGLSAEGGTTVWDAIPGFAKFDPEQCIEQGLTLTHESKRDGRAFHFIVKGLPDLGVGHVYGSDVTDLHKAQEEQTQMMRKTAEMDRMASIGQLAGGVAHEINNALAGVIGMAELFKIGIVQKEDIDLILHEGNRAGKIAQDLLMFARPQSASIEDVHIGRLLHNIQKITRNDLKVRKIVLVSRISPDLPAVPADTQQIHQVFLNLILNARDAMPEGGRIEISVGIEDGQLCVDVDDTGAGIPPPILNKIFDPFFSTKPASKGTGLGLSVVLGIIRAHNGTIEASNRPEGGARFTICLPLSGPSGRSLDDRSIGEPAGRGLAILIVDDEPTIRYTYSRLLTSRGYRVQAAESVDQAMERLKTDTFDVILCDQTLPGKNGIELYRKLHNQGRPEARRFILMSGLPPTGLDADITVLLKPVNFPRLIEEIQKIARTRA